MIVIAMTREIGSHGSDVAAGLVNELGLTVVNSEIVASNVAGRIGVEEGTVQRYLEGSASIFERWQIDKRKLSRYTSEEILTLAQQGNVLIRGWGAAALFRDIPQVISVRICTPMALRVRLMTERLGIEDADAIRQEIERFDAAHAKTMRASFNVERDDALLYHMVLNTARMPIDACVKAICQLAQDPRFQDDATIGPALADNQHRSVAQCRASAPTLFANLTPAIFCKCVAQEPSPAGRSLAFSDRHAILPAYGSKEDYPQRTRRHAYACRQTHGH